MVAAAGKKKTIRSSSGDGDVSVRVSARAPRAKLSTPPAARAHNLATALVEAVVGQLGDYIENSPAVGKLIRAQTRRVLRDLARDPELTVLIRAQAEQYLADLAAHPEVLEPLIRSQVDHYLDHLLANPARFQAVSRKLKQAGAAPSVTPADLDPLFLSRDSTGKAAPVAPRRKRKPRPKQEIQIE